MEDIKTEETMTDNGDDDQWLYGDSNSNLDSVSTSIQDVKPTDFIGIVADEVIFFRIINRLVFKKKIVFYTFCFTCRKHGLWNSWRIQDQVIFKIILFIYYYYYFELLLFSFDTYISLFKMYSVVLEVLLAPLAN